MATGEAWLGEEAFKLGLVDQLKCSDDHLMNSMKERDVYKVSLKKSRIFLGQIF